MANEYDKALQELGEVQRQELSIIKLGEPISYATPNAPKRSSDASADGGGDNPSPASLAADLNHYKELFSKLRFSYLEQVTKEKFLRAIVGDPPQIVENADNVALESELAIAKAELKAHKLEVAGMIEEIEARGRDLSSRYETIQLQTTQLQTLPQEIEALERDLVELRAASKKDEGTKPELNMPLGPTKDLLAEKQAELERLDKQLKALQQTVPRKTREAERLDSELKPLEVQRAGTVAAAEDARRRKEAGERGVGDELELKGRWYRSVQTGVHDLVGAGA